ncbi:drug/metabolite transporter (DMT)-like permease [Rhodococcus fascians]|uniref:DMT family transporter n=1 Tax=Nocardiaceae TaxID=85025 RepID=UPI00285A9CDB|nr:MULTISPECIES: DMT family transporter [Rhodococcus]MDR6909738.1 drug/metabolite transporter (DMT)-like permease [Rhodococcus sp. 3258]MDR6931616.1 drug/metabolite transporter (DMT)-like permease [Rhodococcus fascians]
MTQHSSATQLAPGLLSRAGLLWGLLGVTAFSFTVPLTRIAVTGGLSPLFVGSGRAVVAAALAAAALALTSQRLPRGRQWVRLGVIAAGVVIGFPVLTSFALTTASAGHSAVVAAAMGYAEGGLLARELGAWQTVSWALVVSVPVTGAMTAFAWWHQPTSGGVSEWAAFAYLAVVSMYLGFFAWYRGLAIGPMSSVSQVQLVQPVLTICWAAILLHEGLTWPVVVGGAAVIVCATVAVRTRMSPSVRQEELSS